MSKKQTFLTYNPWINTLMNVIKGGFLTVSTNFSMPSWTKMSEISKNTVENINAIDQIILTFCTTNLHRYHRVTLYFWDFHQKKFHEIPSPLLLPFQEYFNYILAVSLIFTLLIPNIMLNFRKTNELEIFKDGPTDIMDIPQTNKEITTNNHIR